MRKIINLLSGRKTYIVAIVTILYAVIVDGWMNHNWQSAITLALQASGLGFLRAGVAKV